MDIKALIIGGYGINADAELAKAFSLAGARSESVHIADLIAHPERLASANIVAFPGGFSYGDHLGSGQVIALLCRRSLRSQLEHFVADGGLVLGVCNGFQALVRMGLLPNRDRRWTREASLIHNECGHFVDGWYPVSFEADSVSVWTSGLPSRLLPVRHGEGRFITRDQASLAALEAEKLVAVRYEGEGPNGSVNSIAGICDPSGRVFGLMPHPEAFLIRENHPGRRRPSASGCELVGIDLFEQGVKAARAAV